MSREHKYRAKRIDNGKWIYGHYQKVWDNIEYLHQIMSDHLLNGKPIFSFIKPIDPKTLGQYINRKDQEGNKLYEGDICELTAEFQGYNAEGDGAFWYRYTGVIVFTPSIGYYLKIAKVFDLDNQKPVKVFTKTKHIVSYRIKRIGNKHQDAQLLK